jgi:hypothetical protein
MKLGTEHDPDEGSSLIPSTPKQEPSSFFEYHSCYRCKDGTKPCVRGGRHRCEFPHAKND